MSFAKINKADFDAWLNSKEMLVYAVRYVPSKYKRTKRLQFSTDLSGNTYEVTFGNKQLYFGEDFDEAAKIYNNVKACV